MITHVLSAASASGLFTKVHVSTDSESIRDVATQFGFEPDFPRPAELADDHAPIMPVLKYVVEHYAALGHEFQEVALIMACAPLITSQDLIGAAEFFAKNGSKMPVLAVAEYPCPIEWAFRQELDSRLVPVQPGKFSTRSQDLLPAYYDAGQFCFFTAKHILESQGSGSDQGFLGYPIDRHKSVDIDTFDDWKFAEHIFNGVNSSLRHKLDKI